MWVTIACEVAAECRQQSGTTPVRAYRVDIKDDTNIVLRDARIGGLLLVALLAVGAYGVAQLFGVVP